MNRIKRIFAREWGFVAGFAVSAGLFNALASPGRERALWIGLSAFLFLTRNIYTVKEKKSE